MANDIRENRPWTKSQIEQQKPNVPMSDSILTGYFANSMNGGHNKVIFFKQVMAGERHKEFRLQGNFKLLTPKTPTYQNLNITFRTYFVPNSRVWTNAEKYTAQKGGSSEIKITEIPNLGGKTIPFLTNPDEEKITTLHNTTIWRDSYIATYIPRIGPFAIDDRGNEENLFNVLPKVSVLPIRGRKAIYNDFERNKEYDTPLYEYKGDEVSSQEWVSYLPNTDANYNNCFMRAKRNDSYYTNYRTELQGFEDAYPPTEMSSEVALLNWAQWEMKIAETRSQAENAQLNDWDVIAKIRGSKKLSEGKVQLIGERTITLNYSAVTQNTNNNSQDVNQEFRTIGTQGAYSYTQIDIPLYAGFEFVEEGYIHVIATISADSVFESGFDRLELNVTPLEQYRPDMLEDKKDVLYECETGTQGFTSANDYARVIGFKRKYSEYFKLANVIGGDLTTNDYIETGLEQVPYIVEDEKIITQKTFQFFETDRNNFWDQDMEKVYKLQPWKDYTDLLINKNQAVKNSVELYPGFQEPIVRVNGQNQCFFVGKCLCIAQLPIDESIKTNYTTWGEH